MTAFLDGWTYPADAELAEGVAELAKLLGADEAAKPSWTRRLVRFGDAWRLLVFDCPKLELGAAPWSQPDSLRRIPAAFPLQEGIELLASDRSPEKELARRDEAVRAHLAQLKAEEEARLKREAELAAAKKQAERDAKEFLWPKFEALATWQQALYLVALDVEPFYGDIAAAIRMRLGQLAGQESDAARFAPPAARWWGKGVLLG